jgi:hypothetical protein
LLQGGVKEWTSLNVSNERYEEYFIVPADMEEKFRLTNKGQLINLY